jgi:hypothetical protein
MNDAPSYSEAADGLHSEKFIPGERAEPAENKIGYDGERIKTSVALFTSKSIKELEGLTFELNALQEFLRSETERVQRDIDNALSGLSLIIDTISPWRNVRPESSVQEKASRPEPRTQRPHWARRRILAFAVGYAVSSRPSTRSQVPARRHLRDRDRGSQDHAPVQRLRRRQFRDPQLLPKKTASERHCDAFGLAQFEKSGATKMLATASADTSICVTIRAPQPGPRGTPPT